MRNICKKCNYRKHINFLDDYCKKHTPIPKKKKRKYYGVHAALRGSDRRNDRMIILLSFDRMKELRKIINKIQNVKESEQSKNFGRCKLPWTTV